MATIITPEKMFTDVLELAQKIETETGINPLGVWANVVDTAQEMRERAQQPKQEVK